MRIGIVGAGLVGRLLAWHLCQSAKEIHLFSEDGLRGEKSCSAIAAGMISPLSELSHLPANGYQLGVRTLELWPKLIASLDQRIFFKVTGTLVITHPLHRQLLDNFIQTIRSLNPNVESAQLNQKQVQQLEPDLTNFIACYLANEACIDPNELFSALANYLLKQGVVWHTQCQVHEVCAHHINTIKGRFDFDKVIDCRGVGAKKDLPQLRGVRGELIRCWAPEVSLRHMIRLLHLRSPCYIVPRANNHYVIGATQIESESQAPVTIRSALQLLSAAVHVHSGFNEAQIYQLAARARPTMLNHFPLVREEKGVIYINGMFRHGFLLAPALTEKVALGLMENESLYQ